jgi:hypothetical protein
MRKLLLVTVVGLLIGTACGKSGPTLDPLALISGAGARAQSEKTAKVSMSVTATAEGRSFSLDGAGALNFVDQAAQFSFDLGKMVQALGGSLPPGTPSTLDFVFTGSYTYFKAPPGASIGAGKSWLKIDTKKLAGAAGAQSFTSDPKSFFDSLKGVSGTITKGANEKVRGIDTTIYKTTIDLEKAVKAVPENQRAALRAQLKQYGSSKIPVTVWVGKDNLIYREEIQAAIPGAGNANVTIEFYDYGKPVSLSIPSDQESLTVTPAEFLRLLGL